MDKICDELIKNKNQSCCQKSRPIVNCPENCPCQYIKVTYTIFRTIFHEVWL